ncbi:MAG: polar amino acid transporter, inner rane subunit [Rhodospirillales bacterium]|nr:polar amino acid transporter, inner rane subunit [Rhodospirillales bacterium]
MDPRFRGEFVSYRWNWGILWDLSPDGQLTYFGTLLAGLKWTMLTAIGAWAIALVMGSLVGVARTLPNRWAQRAASAYVELFRNTPLLMQLFLWYFILPELLPHDWGTWMKSLRNAPLYTAIIGLGLYSSARVAEQVRAGISSLSHGQGLAGQALGFTTGQVYRYVLLPMAYRIILPPLTSEFLNTIKNTSVALTIGLLELTARARAMQEFSFQIFEAFTVATLLYLVLNLVVVACMRRLERAVALPGYITAQPAKA